MEAVQREPGKGRVTLAGALVFLTVRVLVAVAELQRQMAEYEGEAWKILKRLEENHRQN